MNTNEACQNFLLHCQNNKQLSYHSINAYIQDLNFFTNFTQAIAIDKYDKQKLKDYFAHLNQQNYAPKTIKRRIACLKVMFRWLELEEIIELNPFNKVDIKIKLNRQLPRNIQKSDLKKILYTAKIQLGLKQDSNYQLKDFTSKIKSPKDFNLLTSLIIVELLFSTGIRVGELVNISIGNIHLYESKIRILGKGQRERYVFITDGEIANLLNSYIALRTVVNPNHSFLLCNSRGKPASTHFVRKLLRLTSSKANISQKITPHMYRHSAACQLLENGLDIRYVQRLLGHQSISTTELYTHVNDNILMNKVCFANVRGGLL